MLKLASWTGTVSVRISAHSGGEGKGEGNELNKPQFLYSVGAQDFSIRRRASGRPPPSSTACVVKKRPTITVLSSLAVVSFVFFFNQEEH